MNEWPSYALSELADIRISNVDKKSKVGESTVQLCNYMDVYSNDYITVDLEFMESTASSMERTKFKVDEGDVLITKDSESPYDIGIPSVLIDKMDDLVCGYHLALIKPDRKRTNPIFLSKQLASSVVSSYFSKMSAGSTRYGLSNGSIARTRISLPSLPRQYKIAGILQTIDQTIEKTEALIEKYQQIKAGLMHDLFTRGIGADGKLRPPREQAPELYQQTPIGWIPKEWDLSRLSKVLEKIDSGWSPSCPEVPPSIGEWGVLKVSAVTKGFYDHTESKTLPNNLQPIPSLEVKNGEIILTRANGVAGLVGKCVQVSNTQKKLMLSDKLLRLSPKSEMMTDDYLGFLMCSTAIKNQIDKSMNGSSGQKNISQADIRVFYCPVPCEGEQHFISEKLLTHHLLIEKEGYCLNKLAKQKSGLMHDLLTGKVQAKVDNPSQETKL